MTSKFTPLTKLKKEQLEEQRRLLLHANNTIRTLEEELILSENELLSQEMPSQGSISLFTQYTTLTQACHDQIIKRKDAIYYAKQERHKVEASVKKAYIEYEKFNYLQVEEEKAHKAKIKKDEALQLDEVAIMGYNAKNNS